MEKMDDIIIPKGESVVINKDVHAYKTLVAQKGLKVVCEKDIKKGDKEATLSYEGRMEIDIPIEYILKSNNILFKEGELLFVKKDYSFKDNIVPGGAIVELAEDVYNVDVMAVIYYEGGKTCMPLELLEPVSSEKGNSEKEGKSVKNDIIDDKLRWDLLPMEEIEDIVKVYHAGAKKYGPNNWQNLDNGINRYRAASQRHMMEYLRGNKIDEETGCYHLAQCAWNIIAMLYLDKHGHGINVDKAKTNRFIEKATLVHNGRYDYSNVVYIKNDEKVEIICKTHGSFMQTPHNHLNGAGCPKCHIDGNKRLMCGVGINDFYGKKTDRSYNVWMHLIKRCYSKNKKGAYKDCTVCDEWKLYSNFKKFYDDNCKNDTFHLDKDILVQGNKIYSPNTCLFVPEEVNETITSEWSDNKSLPVGVTMTKLGKFRARCCDGSKNGKQKHLGVFDTPEEAFEAYKEAKLNRLKKLAEKYVKSGDIDKRVYDAILNYKILPFKA